MNLKDRLKELCKSRNTTIAELEKALNFGSGTICRWGTSMPTSEKILAVADYFGVSVDYLLGREIEEDDIDAELQLLHDDPNLRAMLSASRDLSADDIKFVTEMIMKMKK